MDNLCNRLLAPRLFFALLLLAALPMTSFAQVDNPAGGVGAIGIVLEDGLNDITDIVEPGVRVNLYGGNRFFYGHDKYLAVSWMTENEVGYINGWADWNGNGLFEENERVIDNHKVTDSGTATFVTQAPIAFVVGDKSMRFTLTASPSERTTATLRADASAKLALGGPRADEDIYPELPEGEVIYSLDKTQEEANKSFNSCGAGLVGYQNCEGEILTINQSNLQPNTFFYTDDDYLACGIAWVDGSCNISTSVQVYCADFDLTAPTPGAGYPYGTAKFTRVVGGFNAGYTDELALERINWMLCNEHLASGDDEINRAIWYYTGTFGTCGPICGQPRLQYHPYKEVFKNRWYFISLIFLGCSLLLKPLVRQAVTSTHGVSTTPLLLAGSKTTVRLLYVRGKQSFFL